MDPGDPSGTGAIVCWYVTARCGRYTGPDIRFKAGSLTIRATSGSSFSAL